mgnify:CR=1 FL=1
MADKAGVRVEPFDEFDPAWYRAAPRGDAAARHRAMSAIAAHYRAHTKTKTGIWRDLAVRKRKTEVDGQLGVLARKGESLGVAMPLTRGLAGIIRRPRRGPPPDGLEEFRTARGADEALTTKEIRP